MTPRSRSRRDRGAAAVEMALVLPVLLLVLGGIVDLGRVMYGQIIVANAAREGARMASVNGATTQTYLPLQIQARVQQAAGALVPFVTATQPAIGSGITISACAVPPTETVAVTTVTVTAPNFKWMMLNVIPQLVGGNIPAPTITASGSMRCDGS